MQDFCNNEFLNFSISINQFHFLTYRKLRKGFAGEIVVGQQAYVSILRDSRELRHFPIMTGNIIRLIGRLLNNRQCQDIGDIHAT